MREGEKGIDTFRPYFTLNSYKYETQHKHRIRRAGLQ
jgi:hypothetical protein